MTLLETGFEDDFKLYFMRHEIAERSLLNRSTKGSGGARGYITDSLSIAISLETY